MQHESNRGSRACTCVCVRRSLCACICLCGVLYMCRPTCDFCMWHLMFTSCGPALPFVGTLLHLISVSALGRTPFTGFIPPADPEDLCRFRLSVWAIPTALLRFSYSTQHVLFITCCHELSKAAMTNAAFLFMKRSCWPHTSNHHYHPQSTASAVQKKKKKKKLPASQERHGYKEWSRFVYLSHNNILFSPHSE